MVEIPYKFVAYACMGLGVLSLVYTIIAGASGGVIVYVTAPLAGFFALMTYLTYKYGFWVVPLLTRGAHVVEVREGGFEIPPSQEAIIKKAGDGYYASVFLSAKIYESTTEKSLEENILYSQYFERAVSSVKFVMKFAMVVYVKDLGKHKEKIETNRAMAQLKLAREREKAEPDVLRIDRYEREVAMWDNQLARIASGEKPMGTLCYLMTTGTGVTKEAAVAAAKAQANELKATVSNALNVEVDLLRGDDMKQCFEWEFFVPPTQKIFEESVSL